MESFAFSSIYCNCSFRIYCCDHLIWDIFVPYSNGSSLSIRLAFAHHCALPGKSRCSVRTVLKKKEKRRRGRKGGREESGERRKKKCGGKRGKGEGRKERGNSTTPAPLPSPPPKHFLEINKGLHSGDTVLTQRDRQIPEPCGNIKNAKVLRIFSLAPPPKPHPVGTNMLKSFPYL